VDLEIRDRTALVFGAGGGLGGAIAKALANEGAKVVVADVNADTASATVEDIRRLGGVAHQIKWELSDLECIDGNVASIERNIGGIDILVNNTGGPPPTPVIGQAPEEWSRYFQMMVLSVIAVTDRIIPGMCERKWGRIITSTSSGVVTPIPNLGISNALRLSLVGWSKTLAREVGRDGVTSNIVLPGRVATQRITYLDEQKAARENRSAIEVAAESTSTIPVGRYGDPREYGDAVAFLASKRASYITGSVIRVDGGLIQSI
jgi:3-oxoacyl-[acyl-carrier protein] reductase